MNYEEQLDAAWEPYYAAINQATEEEIERLKLAGIDEDDAKALTARKFLRWQSQVQDAQ